MQRNLVGSRSPVIHELSRRAMLRQALALSAVALRPGAVVGVVASLFGMTGCKDPVNPLERATIDLRNDAGVLNYLYALAQLERDFYDRVLQGRFPGMLATERDAFTAYRSAAQSATNDFQNTHHDGRITDYLLFDFREGVNFADRASVMTTAQTIADATARGASAVVSYASDAATVTKATDLADAAVDRANAIRDFNGDGPITITSISPAEVMQTLAPYYRTTIAVVVA